METITIKELYELITFADPEGECIPAMPVAMMQAIILYAEGKAIENGRYHEVGSWEFRI